MATCTTRRWLATALAGARTLPAIRRGWPSVPNSRYIIGSDAFLVILQRTQLTNAASATLVLSWYLTTLAPVLDAAAANGQVMHCSVFLSYFRGIMAIFLHAGRCPAPPRQDSRPGPVEMLRGRCPLRTPRWGCAADPTIYQFATLFVAPYESRTHHRVRAASHAASRLEPRWGRWSGGRLSSTSRGAGNAGGRGWQRGGWLRFLP